MENPEIEDAKAILREIQQSLQQILLELTGCPQSKQANENTSISIS